MNYNRKALKQEARSLMRETWPRVWVVTLVLVLLVTALPMVVGTAINPAWRLVPQMMEDMADFAEMVETGRVDWDVLEDMGLDGLAARAQRGGQVSGEDVMNAWQMNMAIRFMSGSLPVMFLSVLFALFAVVMHYGYYGYALQVFRREQTGVGTIFGGFPLAGKIIGTQIMVILFSFLWVLLIAMVSGVLAGLCALVLKESAMSVVTTLLSFAGSVLGVWVTLRYCLVPFFVMSDPDQGVLASITAGKRAMKGNYIKKFVLNLSFLGWAMLLMFLVYLLLVGGMAAVLFTAGASWMQELEAASRTVMTDAQAFRFLSEHIHELFDAVLLPMVLVMGGVWLVTLPLSLWLRAYMAVTDAGFFLTVTGPAIIVDGEPAPAPGSLPRLVEPSAPVEPTPVESLPIAEEPAPVEPPVEEPPVEETPADEPPAE